MQESESIACFSQGRGLGMKRNKSHQLTGPAHSEKSDYTIRIQNIICTADMMQRIDVQRLNDFQWGRFDIEANYGKVGYVKGNMQGRVSVFESGKLISTGAKSVSGSAMQLKKTMKLLVAAKLATKAKLCPVVRNIVATVDLHKRIDIHIVARTLPKSVYEPEQFPGVIHKTSGGVACLIFASGKLVIAGTKSEKELLQIAEELAGAMKQFYDPTLK